MKKMLKRDWEGRYVRLLFEQENNGGDVFSAGTIMRVHRNFGGLHLWVYPSCPRCERLHREFIKGVPESAVDLLPENYRPDKGERALHPTRREPGEREVKVIQSGVRGGKTLVGRDHEAMENWRLRRAMPKRANEWTLDGKLASLLIDRLNNRALLLWTKKELKALAIDALKFVVATDAILLGGDDQEQGECLNNGK